MIPLYFLNETSKLRDTQFAPQPFHSHLARRVLLCTFPSIIPWVLLWSAQYSYWMMITFSALSKCFLQTFPRVLIIFSHVLKIFCVMSYTSNHFVRYEFNGWVVHYPCDYSLNLKYLFWVHIFNDCFIVNSTSLSVVEIVWGGDYLAEVVTHVRSVKVVSLPPFGLFSLLLIYPSTTVWTNCSRTFPLPECCFALLMAVNYSPLNPRK